MSRHWEECWRFETANLAIVFEVTDCDDDPADSFEFDDDIAAVRDGTVEWFDARVRVLLTDGRELGADYLACCAYNTVREFYTSHREHKSGDYFTDMVREACRYARQELATIRGIRLRAA